MIEFAEKKHRDFGHYVRTHKEYINARIQKCHLIDYANDFSEEIKDRFKVKLEQLEKNMPNQTINQCLHFMMN